MRRTATLAAPIAIAAAIAIGWLASRPEPGPGPLLLAGGGDPGIALERARVELADGSRIEISDARLEVLENTGDHVRFWLHTGAARFDVVPGGPRRWVIETGLVTVEVLGTSFRVARRTDAVVVAVERGTVLVRGEAVPGGMQRLGEGDEITVSESAPAAAAQGDGDGEAGARTGASSPASVTPGATSALYDVDVEASRRPGARAAADGPGAPDRRASDADESARRQSATEAPATELPVTELPAVVSRLREADALRGAGRLDEAVELLDAIAADPAAGRERGLAAFTRARIELDRRGRPTEAAASFALAIELGLNDSLLEIARARRVEALVQASDPIAARAAAAEYLSAHPRGEWRARVEAWAR
jgi:transmembrane sensor